jgi:hypothetical protein
MDVGRKCLIFVMLLSLMKNSMMYALYGVDKEVFVQMFCVNKDRPELHCDGKCELSKMLDAKDQEKAAQVLLQMQLDIPFLSTPPRFVFRTLLPLETEKIPTLYHNLYAFDFVKQGSKPPEYV